MRVWDELKQGDFKNAVNKGILDPIHESSVAAGKAAYESVYGAPVAPAAPPQQGQKGDAWAQYQYLRALDAQIGTPWMGSAPESREQLAQRRRGFRFGDFGNGADSSG